MFLLFISCLCSNFHGNLCDSSVRHTLARCHFLFLLGAMASFVSGHQGARSARFFLWGHHKHLCLCTHSTYGFQNAVFFFCFWVALSARLLMEDDIPMGLARFGSSGIVWNSFFK